LVLGVVGAVVLAGLGYVVFTRGSSPKATSVTAAHHTNAPSTAPLDPLRAAQAILIEPTDFPAGWRTIGSAHLGTTTSDGDPIAAKIQKCVGAVKTSYGEVDSPQFTDGNQLYTATVQTYDSAPVAKRDLSTALTAKTVPCLKEGLRAAMTAAAPDAT